jgi:hypothetical protein
MTAPGDELTFKLHSLIVSLPRFSGEFGRSSIPQNGIYFFFESGERVEIDGAFTERIVRVGTHLGTGNLPGRLKKHYSGKRRTSVFRRHVGGAILAKQDAEKNLISTWTRNKSVPMPELELEVDNFFRQSLTFSCVQVIDAKERIYLEGRLIGLLSTRPLGSPSSDWLGHHSIPDEIRNSGVWNRMHVGGVALEWSDFDRLSVLALR